MRSDLVKTVLLFLVGGILVAVLWRQIYPSDKPQTPPRSMALSPTDPNSYSRPDLVKATHVHLDLEVDFDKQVLAGHVILTLEKIDTNATSVVLDARSLTISKVTEELSGQVLEYEYGSPSGYGEKLEIKLPSSSEKELKIRVEYVTSVKSSALQWLSPAQTAGKKHPYVFSQCQAVHARSMLPCQDSPYVKAPYTATITAPSELTVLMSAIRDGDDQVIDGKKITKFTQKVPIQSYLIAIAVGAIVSKKIGPRSHVWSEQEFVEKAAFDFSETESFIKTAEDLCGPYVWGIYDILVLPPSFPFGGMENPCMTFATPTLLSGDKSNADVVAHEIAHSWTGNLVTNSNFEHFWLNEGFTVFTERKIKGRLHGGEPARHFSAILRWRDLEETVNKVLGPTNPNTALVPNLVGVDPDDAFSVVPYEKGSTFLWYLEDLVGGPEKMEPFLKFYYTKFAYKSIDSNTFKETFLDYYKDTEAVKDIDWDTWFNKPGMPIWKPKFDESLGKVCWDLAKKWQDWDPSTPADFGDSFSTFSPEQTQEFLGTLINADPLDIAKVEKMSELYGLGKSPNVEILFRWIRLGLKAKWEPSVAEALKLATIQGRMKFVRPLYRDLYGWEEKRQQTIDHYLAHKDEMMYVTAEMVARDLHLSN